MVFEPIPCPVKKYNSFNRVKFSNLVSEISSPFAKNQRKDMKKRKKRMMIAKLTLLIISFLDRFNLYKKKAVTS